MATDSDMRNEDPPFGFTPAWYSLGIVTPARLAVLRDEWARGEDLDAGHYRWRAFTTFLAEAPRPLAPGVLRALYALGEADEDRALGAAMMHRVLAQPECPVDLDSAARATGRRDLAQAIERRGAHAGAENL